MPMGVVLKQKHLFVTVSIACGLSPSTGFFTDVGSIRPSTTTPRMSPGAGPVRWKPGSRSDQAGCSRFAALYRKPTVLGRLHRMGWAGLGLGWAGLGWQSCPISVAEYSASTGRGPAALWAATNKGALLYPTSFHPFTRPFCIFVVREVLW